MCNKQLTPGSASTSQRHSSVPFSVTDPACTFQSTCSVFLSPEVRTYLGSGVGVILSSQWVSGSSDNHQGPGRSHSDRVHSPPLWRADFGMSCKRRLQGNNRKMEGIIKNGQKDPLKESTAYEKRALWNIQYSEDHGNCRALNVPHTYWCGNRKSWTDVLQCRGPTILSNLIPFLYNLNILEVQSLKNSNSFKEPQLSETEEKQQKLGANRIQGACLKDTSTIWG